MVATLLMIFGCALNLRADDTEIYGTVNNPSLEPNVMVLFDTSGSMATEDVPGDPYEPSQTYTCGSCTYSTNAVYYRRSNNGNFYWDLFASDINDLGCPAIKNSLLTQGYADGYIRSSGGYTCGGQNYRRLRTGNYLNYVQSGVGMPQSRISVAQQVLADLIQNTDGVRFGMFVFNYNQGGRLVAPCGTAKATLLSQVAAASPNGWTPLAETMAEIGLYFAGMPSWYDSGTYTSPMQERCQKNYVIIMTDGEPTQDRDSRLYETPYINGDIIGDYDHDQTPCDPTHHREYWDPTKNCLAYPDNGSDYLDDVAKYLYENDCNPLMGDGTSFDKQNIVTFTIGFKTNQSLLQRAAAKGGGEYFTAENYSELKEAFSQIMSSIVEKNACYVAPVVPISRMNRVFAGDKIYLGFFKPQQSGRWFGNIKRYALQNDGTLVDAKSENATTADGLIKDNALSWWTSLGNDGPAVEKGGAAEALSLQIEGGTARKVYTYTGQPLLTDSSNAFVSTNTVITNTMLNVADDTARLNLFTSVREGVFGDIIHSEPAVVVYETKTVIYVGANDGLLHCIDDANGQELWSFIPPEHIGRLWRMNDADHDYFVDGSPTVHYGGAGQKILVIGSRRGGESYVALDVTDYSAPLFLYSIGPTILGPSPTDYEHLGQSWCRPEKITVATGSTVTETGCGVSVSVSTADVFLFGGGYDTNQDNQPPTSADGVGRGVFAVNMTTGALINSLKFTPATHSTLGLSNAVVDVSGFDHDGDGIVSRIYFGDLGGAIFALKDDQVQTYTPCSLPITKTVVDGVWSGMKLFQTPTLSGKKLKILYAPDAVAERYPPSTHGEYIFFGTGDRENPGDTTMVNRFYAVKNDWTATAPYTESNLVDVTTNDIQLGTAAEKAAVKSALETHKGWFIQLENAGEKVVSSPRVYGGVVYFTTYTPSDDSGINPTDPCAASTVRGVSRLYAVDYKTGGAVHDFSTTAETDHSGTAVSLGKLDRSLAVGTAIPSAPVIAVLAGGARLFIGVEGGIVSLPTIATQDMYRYYWNQIF
jgi:type IV pilus assembly protein PilY1